MAGTDPAAETDPGTRDAIGAIPSVGRPSWLRIEIWRIRHCQRRKASRILSVEHDGISDKPLPKKKTNRGSCKIPVTRPCPERWRELLNPDIGAVYRAGINYNPVECSNSGVLLSTEDADSQSLLEPCSRRLMAHRLVRGILPIRRRVMDGVTHITVTEAHCDRLGHLNHVEAVRYLERARGQWYRDRGLYEGDGERRGTVVVNIDYNYRAECFLGETLKITTRPVSMGTKSFTLAHEIIRPDGRVAVDGRCTSVIMDLGDRVIVPVPECLATHLPKRG